MSRYRVIALAGAGLLLSSAMAAPGYSAPASPWHIDRVVVVMRHGVRPPTKAEPLPAGMAKAPWPAWDVGWGELTHHGEQAIALSGAFDRATYAPVLGTGCPDARQLRVVADVDQRTLRTAEVYASALAPGCPVAVDHVAMDAIDPRFTPFEGEPILTPQRAEAAAREVLPQAGLTALDHQLSGHYATLNRILDCHDAACAIATRPTALVAAEGRVKLTGALGMAAGFAQTLLLEYADGKPMAEVGWGRATRADITALSTLHAEEFAITARASAIAAAGSRALLDEVTTALSAPEAPRFSLFVGHDANLSYIGGRLGLHWHARQFAPDDPPPGGALIFERWSNGKGRYRLHLRFRSASLDEIRHLAPLQAEDSALLDFAACAKGRGCDAAGLAQGIHRDANANGGRL